MTGRYSRQTKENELEALTALRRDRHEKDGQIERHPQERETVHMLARQKKQGHAQDVERIHRDIAAYQQRDQIDRPNLKEQFRETATPQKQSTTGTGRTPEQERGPSRDPR